MFNTAEKLFVVVFLTTYLFEIFHACISHETFNFQSVDHWRYAEASESSFIQGGIEEAKQGDHNFESFLNPQDFVNQGKECNFISILFFHFNYFGMRDEIL